MARRRKSYSRVSKRAPVATTIRQTTRSRIDLVGVTANVIDTIGLDTLTTRYNNLRYKDGMWPVTDTTVARYGRGGASTENGLPAHFSAFIVNQALRLCS